MVVVLGASLEHTAHGAEYLKEVVVMKERSVVLQLSLMSLLYLILPLLLQFGDTLKATHEIIRHRARLFVSFQVGSLIYFLPQLGFSGQPQPYFNLFLLFYYALPYLHVTF